ncbi:MAG: PQQ-binding-like beta-propeller repeat protein [Planctomycetota bacterium]
MKRPLEPIHPLNSYASSTPATDGKRVFVTFLDVDKMYVAAFDFDGNRLWDARPGPFASKHGFCTNPVLYRDSVILNGDHDGDAYIVSLRQENGKEVWRIPRENKTRSYCTPIIVREGEVDQIMLNGSFCTAGYDAQNGKQIWICDGPSEQMVATLVVGHGLIFSLGGFPERHLLAIRRGKSGNLNDQIVWRTHQGIPYVPSPLLYGNYLHVVSDDGFYTCFDPTTGNTLTRKRACKHVSSSLLGGLERVYLTEDDGRTVVIANQPGFKILAENSIGEEIYSSPAASRGNLFLRGKEHLFCIGATKEKGVAGN